MKRNIKFVTKKYSVDFDAELFKTEIKQLNIRIDRPESFSVSLFDSGLFGEESWLSEKNIQSFLTCILDFGYIDNYQKTLLNISFRCERLAREIQSLLFSMGIPCDLHYISMTCLCLVVCVSYSPSDILPIL